MRLHLGLRLGVRVLAAAIVALGVATFASPAAAADMTITQSTRLTADVSGTIFVGADGITLDCAGHQITTSAWAAVDLTDRTGVTVKNCRVGGASVGIWMNRSSGNRITGNTATGNGTGIWLFDRSQDDVVSGNDASGNSGYGFWIQGGSDGNLVSDNTANDNL
jgi:parallel beta-helix repeat protein